MRTGRKQRTIFWHRGGPPHSMTLEPKKTSAVKYDHRQPCQSNRFPIRQMPRNARPACLSRHLIISRTFYFTCLRLLNGNGKVNTRASRQIPWLRNGQISVFNVKGNLSTSASRKNPWLRNSHRWPVCRSLRPLISLGLWCSIHGQRIGVLASSAPLAYAVGSSPIHRACHD